jgi:nucleoside-triphosphatase THEP1
MMTKKILLIGRPGCGKTTLIKRVVDELALPAGVFYTEEVRENGERVGFKMITLDGQEALLAHVDFKTPQRLGKYGLDPSALEKVGVAALREAMRARQLVVLDEIGPMELRSAIFRDVVTKIFAIGVRFLPRLRHDRSRSPIRSRSAGTSLLSKFDRTIGSNSSANWPTNSEHETERVERRMVAQASCLWGNRASRVVAGNPGRQDARRPHSQDGCATASYVSAIVPEV